MINFLLVAKDWGGGLARYLNITLCQRNNIQTRWLKTYPCGIAEKFRYRSNRHRWRTNLRHSINYASRDIALFINLPDDPELLNYHPGNILWLTDAPRYGTEQLAAFSRIYVSDPGYAAEVSGMAGDAKFAGVLPFACLPSMHSIQPGNIDSDICFVGRRDPHRDAFIEQLLKLESSCHIYGNYFLQHRLFWQQPSAFRRSVSNASLAYVYARHRLSLNIHAQVVRAGTNMRTYECAACGIPQLVESRPGLEDLFIPDEEICLFNSIEEMQSVLNRLLFDSALRTRISRNARKRVLAEHTYSHRLDTLLTEF